MSATGTVRVFDDPQALARGAAAEVLARGREAVARRGCFTLALSGGGTPTGLYRRLRQVLDEPGQGGVEWGAVHLFWGDERPVPPEDPESNYRTARAAWLDHPAIPEANLHRIPAERGAAEAAAAYEEDLAAFFDLAPGEMPRFDAVLLGLGGDGHTASLFPGSAALEERRRLVTAPWVKAQGSYRITLTYPVLEAAREVIFLVSGAGKAEVLRRVVEEHDPRLPAARVRPKEGELLWLVDRAAAGN